MENFNNEIEKVSAVYEKAKDNLIRLRIKKGQHDLQTDLFENLKYLRDVAVTALENGKESDHE